MATRVRYIKTRDPNIVKSKRIFIGQQGGLYQAMINTKELTYKVKNMKSQRIVRSNEIDNVKAPKNLYTVKEQVKRALLKVGIKFDIDLRGLG